MDKNIKISEEVHKRLCLIKIERNYSRLRDIITDMLDIQEKIFLAKLESKPNQLYDSDINTTEANNEVEKRHENQDK